MGGWGGASTGGVKERGCCNATMACSAREGGEDYLHRFVGALPCIAVNPLSLITLLTPLPSHQRQVNEAIAADSYYQALKTLDAIERDHLRTIPARSLKAWVQKQVGLGFADREGGNRLASIRCTPTAPSCSLLGFEEPACCTDQCTAH